jgi:putative membrane protein insertion efficiency factor
VGKVVKTISSALVLAIKAYQYLLSPLLGNRCRFYPSCSSYAIDALKMHGCSKGCFLTLTRVLRCHPWHQGGIDPVPEQKSR